MITQSELKQVLNYNQDTGIFTWKIDIGKKYKAGQQLKSTQHGYIRITYKQKTYKAHRLAWLYVYGKLPDNFIDHINGIRNDNRICNLRDVTHTENNQNQRKPHKSNKSSGLLGTTWHIRDCRWQASIKSNGKTIFLGNFDDKYSAHNAYLNAKRLLHSTCEI
jgi:hypothetical protein